MAETAWLVEAIRATLFTSAAAPQSPRVWWESFAGVPSAELQVSEGPTGHASAQGEVPGESALLALGCQPGRIDWSYVFATIAVEGKLSLAANNNFSSSLEQFSARFQRWLPLAPMHTRVALGAVLQFPVDSRADGYRRLQDYLPYVKLDPENSSDLNYRINRPRLSKKSPFELKINRMSVWSVAALHVQLTQAKASVPVSTSSSSMFCRLELDLSTAAENSSPIDQQLSAVLFDELKAMALEIASRGDQP